MLQRTADELGSEGIEVVTDAREGDPAHVLLDVAKEQNADMIVVGTREPGTLKRLLGQSISESVAHHAHCDVLIVHPGQ